MAEANFKHPKYPDAREYLEIIKQTHNEIISRVEYPDGVIVVFHMKPEGVNITSNYGFRMSGNNMITPWLEKPNNDFVDVK